VLRACYIVVLYLQNPIKTYLDLLFGTWLEWSGIICLSKLGSLVLWCKTSGPEQLKRTYPLGSKMYKAAIIILYKILNLWTQFRPAKFDNDKLDEPYNKGNLFHLLHVRNMVIYIFYVNILNRPTSCTVENRCNI